jgi:hypothetical protein
MKALLVASVLAVMLAVPTVAQAYCRPAADSASVSQKIASLMRGGRTDVLAGNFSAAHDKAYKAFIDYDTQMACDARSLRQRPHLLAAIQAFGGAYKQYQAGHADLGLPYLSTLKSELALASAA